MNAKEIKDQKIWDDFIIATGSQFLQSWGWGELQAKLNRPFWRLGIEDNGQLVAAVLVVKHQIPHGKNYLYSPRGPVVADEKYLAPLFEEIKTIAKKEDSIFYRLEPGNNFPARNATHPPATLHARLQRFSGFGQVALRAGSVAGGKFQISNFKFKKTGFVQPPRTLILDLKQSEEEIINNFDIRTRYNVRLAEKKGVTVRVGEGEKDFQIFWKLLQKTYFRQGIKTHPEDYYRQIFETSNANFKVKLFIAEYQGTPLIANLLYFYGKVATHAHGGSSDEYRQFKGAQLAQWEQIKTAKQLGYEIYDFWGIDEKRWPGVTHFKLGFNGQEISYPGTFDLPLNKLWYGIYRIGRKVL